MANPNEQTPELGRTLQFDTPQTTPSNTVITEASPSQTRSLKPDYQVMIELMQRDLAELQATQRRQHELLLALQIKCQELKAQTGELARAGESHFFTPIATTSQNQINRSPSQTVAQVLIIPGVLHIPLPLHPAELEGMRPPAALRRVTEATVATTAPQTTNQSLLLL